MVKPKLILKLLLSILLLPFSFFSCNKEPAGSSGNLDAISGNWQNTTWGGPDDTVRINIATATAAGAMVYISSNAEQATNFSAGDVIFSNIKYKGGDTFTANGNYRYGVGNRSLATANVILVLQNNNTMLYAHYSNEPAKNHSLTGVLLYLLYAHSGNDSASNITPPDYYWRRQ